tara:strand:- start:237 stop:959 length:723 start_codon:yes stop_codon:yes gene_type:complete
METIFISDLHLDKTRPNVINYFIKFIENQSVTMDNLYILGDFVESWVGDDDPADGITDAFELLKSISKKTKIYFMHGNRDFMISSKICNKYGMELIDDPTIVNLYNRRILLMHGDTLCVDDIKYQEFRQLVRNKSWQLQMMEKPLEERLMLADALRNKSMDETTHKNEFIMDVNEEEVKKCFRDSGAEIIIHGHTHRPMVHEVEIDKRKYKRAVLGDWGSKSHVIILNEKNFELKEIQFK